MTKRKINNEELAERLREIVLWSKSRKRNIEEDSRFKDKPANAFVNAPLALIQVHLKAEHHVLDVVLKIAEGKIP